MDIRNGPSCPKLRFDRALVGTVPYGQWIYSCKKKGQVAITFDDGPLEYTRSIAEKFDQAGFKATFFMVGYFGYRKIYDNGTRYPELIRSLHQRGHQLASHTWTHMNLDNMTQDARFRQMTYNDRAFARVLGFAPTYMRPPFGLCSFQCMKNMKDLGYHTVSWDIDTKDFEYDSPEKYRNAIQLFDFYLDHGGSITLAHDTKFHTADKLVPHMIATLKKRGLTGVTIGECLGDPKKNWYRTAEVTK